MRICVLVGLLALAPLAGAGEKTGPLPPGPEHKQLAQLAGAFDAKVTMFVGEKKIESKGAMKREMILNGRFLKEDFEGAFGDQPFKGMGVSGYDTAKKKYVSSWVDSMSNSMLLMDGTYDAKTKTYTYTGPDSDLFTGKAMKARDVLRVVSADEQVLEMYRQAAEGGGKETKVMEIVYKRKK